MKVHEVVGEIELLVVELGDELGVEWKVFCPSKTPEIGVLSSSVTNSFNGLKFHFLMMAQFFVD